VGQNKFHVTSVFNVVGEEKGHSAVQKRASKVSAQKGKRQPWSVSSAKQGTVTTAV
jgi:hypothetical protein